MFSLGTSEFVKNIRRYIVVIFQIAAGYNGNNYYLRYGRGWQM